MLEEFIKTNGVDAKIISFHRDTNLQSALFETKLSLASVIIAEFVMNEKNQEFILVHSIKSVISIEKVKHVIGSSELFGKEDEEIFEATGYKKEYLPPIGIYGVRVYVDRSLQGKEHLLCKVGDREFLKISPQEIVDSNEDALVENITK